MGYTVGRSRVLGCGLPQGSYLSLCLWNIYVADLHIKNRAIIQYSFADDTSFHTTGNTWEEVTSTLNDVARGWPSAENGGYRLTFKNES